jgi:cation efflux family protein
LVSIAAATLLVLLNLVTGIVSGSLGVVPAGIESSGDVVVAVLTFFAIRLGGRPADERHNYGHRRPENLGALGEAAILFAGGTFIVTEAISQLRHGGMASRPTGTSSPCLRSRSRSTCRASSCRRGRRGTTSPRRYVPTPLISPGTWRARSLCRFCRDVGYRLRTFQRRIARAHFGDDREVVAILPRGSASPRLPRCSRRITS